MTKNAIDVTVTIRIEDVVLYDKTPVRFIVAYYNNGASDLLASYYPETNLLDCDSCPMVFMHAVVELTRRAMPITIIQKGQNVTEYYSNRGNTPTDLGRDG